MDLHECLGEEVRKLLAAIDRQREELTAGEIAAV